MRTITGILFVAGLVACIVYNAQSFAILFTAITALTLWEYAQNINRIWGTSINLPLLAASGAILFLLVFSISSRTCDADILAKLGLSFLLSLLLIPLAELYMKAEKPLHNWAFSFAGIIYIALPLSLLSYLAFLFPTQETGYNYTLPLSVFLFLWTNDTGAYCVGSMLHKYIPAKLFPRISPAKSWIGSIGGGLLCLVMAAIISHYSDLLSLGEWMGFSLVVCITGTWGDLIESHLKRTLGIKDSGNILPGHGGLLDRFDSSLFAIPASVIYFLLLDIL